MKIAVIVDDDMVQRFALDSIDALEGTGEITIFSCTNTRFRRNWLRHCAYYALNLLTVRNPLTRPVSIHSGRKRIESRTEFASGYEGMWQTLPPAIVSTLNRGRFDLVLKFGMGLLRVPPDLKPPILSFHHGDPDRYRGRPAGFWEIADGAEVLGQIVQVIGNRLDSGRVVAFAETKVMPWSYRRTLIEAFRHSPLIINAAVSNTISGATLEKLSEGHNYRLPSNRQTAAFVIRMTARFVRRLLYGALVEKRWNVSIAPIEGDELDRVISGEDFPSTRDWTGIPAAADYVFYADPFLTTDPPGLLVEGLHRRTGVGDILFIQDGISPQISSGNGHMSYPSVARIRGREIVVPETASWSPPLVCTLLDGRLEAERVLNIKGTPRITDPTLIELGDRIYLFGNVQSIGPNALHLWSAECLEGEFSLHPAAPVRISPRGGRMGGGIVKAGDRLVRFGQDSTRDYGHGLFAFEIMTLTENSYAERPLGRIAFADRKGPHTLNIGEGTMVFDWYLERASPFAGIRRLSAKRSAMANRGGDR